MEASNISLETLAAEALFSLSFTNFSFREAKPDLSFSDSCPSSSSSSVVTKESSSTRNRRDPLRLLAIAAYYAEKKIKATKRKRSRTYCLSSNTMCPLEHEAASMLSTNSVTHSQEPGRDPITIVKRGWATKKLIIKGGQKVGNSGIRRCADAILNLLTGGRATEIRIRAVLGDSPDTSKALRTLLKWKKVKRSGAGGRYDPFQYEIAGSSSEVDSA